MNRLVKSVALAGAACVALFSGGCASVHSQQVAFNKEPGSCQITEVRPTVLSTLSYVVCWDDKGEEIGMTGGTGTSIAEVTATAAIAAAVGAGSGAIAASIPGVPSMLGAF